MYREMLRYLRENGATSVQIAHYNEHWRRADHNPSQPIPCPTCYLAGSVSRLTSLPAVAGIAKVRCDVCHRFFDYKIG
jgi:hypothetical protein